MSRFLAKVMGIYYVILGVAFALNINEYRGLFHRLINTPDFIFIGSAIALIIGALLVVSHNIWQLSWRMVITVIGWLILIKGIVNLVFPRLAWQMNSALIENTYLLYILTGISLLLGLFLCYHGFKRSQRDIFLKF